MFDANKPIRLIELFAGIGSQAMALRNAGIKFEHHRVVEFDKHSIASYNAIHNTSFIPIDITDISGADLGIVNTNEFIYLLTYSFPCQDLSIAGKGKGMTKGYGTRSSLLWEVERLLNEAENLPQILLMENVPQVHSKKNMHDFQSWLDYLTSKGYKTFWQDLNAKDYGIAQSRKRCFAVSILDDLNFTFPTPIPLTSVMRDYLESQVEDKYYLTSDKAKKLIDMLVIGGKIPTGGQYSKEICIDLTINSPRVIQTANCIKARYDAGISNQKSDGTGVCEIAKLDDCTDVSEIELIGTMDNSQDHTFESANRVYSVNGVSPTVNTCGGGGVTT